MKLFNNILLTIFLTLGILTACEDINLNELDDLVDDLIDAEVIGCIDVIKPNNDTLRICPVKDANDSLIDIDTTLIKGGGSPPPGGSLPAVDIDDLLVTYIYGQSNVCYPTDNDSIPSSYAWKDSTLSNGSSVFIWNAHWPTTFNPSLGCYGSYVSYVHKLDSMYPGQVRVVYHNANATRLRNDIRTSKFDWNANSVNENWDRSKNFAIGKALIALKNDNPTKNIRFISIIVLQTESDSEINTSAGDDAGITNDQARDTYITDMQDLTSGQMFYFDSIGIDTTEIEIKLVETGLDQVSNRPLNHGISQAQDSLVANDSRIVKIPTIGTGMYTIDGTHYSASSHIQLGRDMAIRDINRFEQ